MKSVTFVGRPGGDGECFCFQDVPEEDCIQILGEERILEFKEDLEKYKKQKLDSLVANVKKMLSRIYPSEIMYALGCSEPGKKSKKYKFTITAEEI